MGSREYQGNVDLLFQCWIEDDDAIVLGGCAFGDGIATSRECTYWVETPGRRWNKMPIANMSTLHTAGGGVRALQVSAG